MGGMGGGGQQQQMMSMSMSSVCLLGMVAVAGGLYYTTMQKPTPPPATMASTMDTSIPGPPSGGPLADGSYNIQYGNMRLAASNKTCSRQNVGFQEGIEGDKHAWNLRAVPGRPGYYYVSSESRAFNNTCQSRFLTAANDCNGSPMLDAPGKADSQYWKLVPQYPGDTTSGRYMLQSASCQNKRQNDYVISSGSKEGWNAAKMTKTSGSPYLITPWGSTA